MPYRLHIIKVTREFQTNEACFIKSGENMTATSCFSAVLDLFQTLFIGSSQLIKIERRFDWRNIYEFLKQ